MPLASLPFRVLVLGAVVFLALFGTFAVLTATGKDVTLLVGVLVQLAGLGGVVVHSEARTRQQNTRLDKIDHQTNGVLTRRIRAGARREIREALVEAGIRVELVPDDDEHGH